MKIGKLYFDESNTSTEEKIKQFIASHYEKTGEIPDTVCVNPSQMVEDETISVFLGDDAWGVSCSVRVVSDPSTLNNHFFIGRKENTEVSVYETRPETS